ncbi:MAG: hypothetical protein ACOYMN_17500 [Roseimicrobium sp.]
MSLHPPSFRVVLALVGASLICWGAKGVVLQIPGLLECSLFEVNRAAAWCLLVAAIAVLTLSWLRTSLYAWLAWAAAMAAMAFLLNDLHTKVHALEVGFAEMRATGLPAPDLAKLLHSTKIRPGAVSIAAGLAIQAIALCMRRRTPS